MKRVGFRVMVFGGAFLAYAMINDEPKLKTIGGIFLAVGLLLCAFGPGK